MSSEAITQNDLREILSRTVGSIPSEYKKLLWTNPSPTSSFAAQTVSLDLSNYDEVEIEFLHANASNSYLYQKARVGSTDVGLFYTSAKNGIPIEVEGRLITVSNTGIVFSDGSRAYNTLTASTDNIRCVPTKIYGIKYERVAPPQMEVPMVAYNENFVGSSGTINKTHTIADNGLYLILARANANSGSAVPAVRIYINNVIQAQNADAGGLTMTYHLATLSAGDIVKGEFSATNAESTQSSWNNLAIIRLGSTS